MDAARLLAEAEENIITRFMEIAGLQDEYRDATNPNEQTAFTEYAQSMLVQEFADRGYVIGHRRIDHGQVVNGIAESMKWRWLLLHDGNDVMYKDIEINVGTMRLTEYGGQM